MRLTLTRPSTWPYPVQVLPARRRTAPVAAGSDVLRATGVVLAGACGGRPDATCRPGRSWFVSGLLAGQREDDSAVVGWPQPGDRVTIAELGAGDCPAVTSLGLPLGVRAKIMSMRWSNLAGVESFTRSLSPDVQPSAAGLQCNH